MPNRRSQAQNTARTYMDEVRLTWDVVGFDDPKGGRILLWPHIPCLRMPSELRTREHWDCLGLLASADEVAYWPEEEREDLASPGIHVDAALASGTILGRLLDDLDALEVSGPAIPDPEPMRLLHHARNARGGLPIYALEPQMEDESWLGWLERSADAQVNFGTLLSRITVGRRWKRIRSEATAWVAQARGVNAELGAASASAAAWWAEECSGLTPELITERDQRMAARMRGALANMRGAWPNLGDSSANSVEGRVDDSDTRGPVLLVPVHQARMGGLVASLGAWPDAESVEALDAFGKR